MLVTKLKEMASFQENRKQGALVNMTDWINFFTMDVIRDLAFGEPFSCLAKGEYHDWVRTLFQKMIPQSVIDGQRRHMQYANDRINRRLDSGSERPDFMTAFMKNNVDFKIMSRDEILSTFGFIIVGGLETSATTLTGIFNHLSRRPEITTRLSKEIRDRFKEEKDIVIDAIHDLPYLQAVLDEGLRMCNPIPGGLPREVPEGGDTYPGVFLPGGVSNSAIHEPHSIES